MESDFEVEEDLKFRLKRTILTAVLNVVCGGTEVVKNDKG